MTRAAETDIEYVMMMMGELMRFVDPDPSLSSLLVFFFFALPLIATVPLMREHSASSFSSLLLLFSSLSFSCVVCEFM